MSNRISKVVYPKVIGSSRHLLLNKFFYQSIPSMRNVDDGEKQEKKTRKEKKRKEWSTNVVASQPLERIPTATPPARVKISALTAI